MIFVVMGVTGSGKTTVGQLLSDKLGCRFADADSFHTAANKEKMHAGIALTDEDRLPWLEGMRAAIGNWIADQKTVVLACSALKKRYRDILRADNDKVVFVYLKGTPELFAQRLKERSSHFMNEDLLPSQFEILEEPDATENAIVIDASQTPSAMVDELAPYLVRMK